jgi:hypothetical protein
MFAKKRQKQNNRRGIAAVEAAVCLPLLIIVWFGTFEVTRRTSLQQQAQLLASNAAHRILESTTEFETIEADTLVLAESLGIEGCQVEISRIDREIVETIVSMDFSQNSPISSILRGQQIQSAYYSYREE